MLDAVKNRIIIFTKPFLFTHQSSSSSCQRVQLKNAKKEDHIQVSHPILTHHGPPIIINSSIIDPMDMDMDSHHYPIINTTNPLPVITGNVEDTEDMAEVMVHRLPIMDILLLIIHLLPILLLDIPDMLDVILTMHRHLRIYTDKVYIPTDNNINNNVNLLLT
jgi:hypothetical protein